MKTANEEKADLLIS